ncbi:polysaccharide biosynthesis tyrosine autokinase [Leucobacter sp. W1153]|uniref:polysaccharide biosynthesis tyrosine autokinase n=1 Tax=Leucobacter sp. W1153 TaxID=3439064 RepID=UPI003F40E5AA
MELRDYIRVLRKNWLLIVVITLIGVGAAAAYSLTRTPLYESTSKVFVSAQGTQSVAELQQGNSFTQARVSTYVSLVSTQTVLVPVIGELELNTSSEELAEKVNASAALNTLIINITVSDADPVLAAELADAIAESLAVTVEAIERPAGSDVSPVRLTQVQQAQVASAPASPNVPVNLALGLLVGLALSIGIAVLREVLDTRVRNERDVRDITESPILGGIAFDPKAKERPLIVQEDPRSPRSESFRALRTNLQFIDLDGRKSFVVTSSIQSEGKSTTAANLAVAMADAGLKVMLVDADMRRPKLATYLDLEGSAGLSDVLAGRAQLADVVQRWGRQTLYVLLAGTVPPNPSELLGSKAMTQLIGDLESAFDVVLFDMPPLLPVTDAAVVAKSAGGAIVVVGVGRTSRHQLEGAISSLEQAGAKLAGLVLSMIPTKGADAYGYGRYGYGSYGYGYTAAPEPKGRGGRRSKTPASS